MLNKILLRIFGFFETIKDFIVYWGIRVLILLMVIVICHNVYKLSEFSSLYSGQYKKMYPVYDEDQKFMNIYQIGDGPKTIVILPGFGSQSPVVQYKALAAGLQDQYKVVIVEYFGYGFSMSMRKEERSNENFAREIKGLLDKAGVGGPYVLMPHSSSNLYAMEFQKQFPDQVQAIVSLDGVYPEEINDKYYVKKCKDTRANVNITSIYELTGFERIASYISPKTFYIDEMKKRPDIFGEEEFKVYRNRIGSNYLSRTMVREIDKLEENMNKLKDYKYPDYLPVLEILASDTVNEYDNAKKNLGAKVDLIELSNNILTNKDIQKVVTVNGKHFLNFSNPEDVVVKVKEFLGSF